MHGTSVLMCNENHDTVKDENLFTMRALEDLMSDRGKNKDDGRTAENSACEMSTTAPPPRAQVFMPPPPPGPPSPNLAWDTYQESEPAQAGDAPDAYARPAPPTAHPEAPLTQCFSQKEGFTAVKPWLMHMPPCSECFGQATPSSGWVEHCSSFGMQ